MQKMYKLTSDCFLVSSKTLSHGLLWPKYRIVITLIVLAIRSTSTFNKFYRWATTCIATDHL